MTQQLHAQQEANLRAIQEARQNADAASKRNAEAIESLRIRVGLATLVGIFIGGSMVAVLLYLRKLLRSILPVARNGDAHGAERLRLDATGSFVTPNNRATDTTAFAALMLAKGQSLLEQKQPSSALACFEQVIAMDGKLAEAFLKKGLTLEQLGRLHEALDNYDRAIALDPSLTDAYLGKGGICNKLERYEDALQCYEQASHARPGSTAAVAESSDHLLC